MNRSDIERRLYNAGLNGRCWGKQGSEVLTEIGAFYGSVLPEEVRDFVSNVGNVTIGPFNIVLAGSDDGSFSALTESRCLPEEFEGALVIMEHAGERYILSTNGDIRVFESRCIRDGFETLRFNSFQVFLEWVFKEALTEATTEFGRDST